MEINDQDTGCMQIHPLDGYDGVHLSVNDYQAKQGTDFAEYNYS